ncbi:hypothetical protein L1286_16840 [Pseudoalteromonas sp. SMS1]|uniref:hypothetical protein n=1 Tax=Pseudoalteromonas sp. SMS1 TaxID=2908894 RepID=UPI001F19CD66|nr:hypothetical protein [Pseudoalteromonas sp. SMS1]MCF2859152.1 hypothetical protein [Pseudoalteromonas sp. SMS1]
MKPAYFNFFLLIPTLSILMGCNSSSTSEVAAVKSATTETATIKTENSGSKGLSAQTLALGISELPATLKETYTEALHFNRYTKVDTPNGMAIHIVAQNQVTDNQIVRARSILMHFLAPLPGSEYGADKGAVANKMSENGAVLMLLNGVDDGTNKAAELDGQPLYYGEIQVEGHPWYIEQDYTHRDASFEEILHLVHDYGIGVDHNATFIGALPSFQAEIRAAQVDALSNNLWGMGAPEWIAELSAENSLSQEYLAAVIDVYYGLWGANTEHVTTGMYDIYVAKVRGDIANEDASGALLLDNKFFSPFLTYNARIDEGFIGDFSLRLNTDLPYSHHAQYLKDVTLTGTNNSNVIVNQLDNNITGNAGENTVIFSGPSSEYLVTNENDRVIVQDMRDNRDGENTLTMIEKLKFSDTTIDVPSN